MSKLPKNIQEFVKQYDSKMKGNIQHGLNAIRTSVQNFYRERSQNTSLRLIDLLPYQNQKGIQNEMLYQVRIKGRKNTYYQGRIIKFYLFFFDTYPNQPPSIIAANIQDKITKTEKRFLHINIGEGGHLCMGTNQKNKEYFEYTTLKDILMQLQKTIYFPNVGSSYNSELYGAYNAKGDNSQYYKILNAQAKFLEINDEESQSQESEQD